MISRIALWLITISAALSVALSMARAERFGVTLYAAVTVTAVTSVAVAISGAFLFSAVSVPGRPVIPSLPILPVIAVLLLVGIVLTAVTIVVWELRAQILKLTSNVRKLEAEVASLGLKRGD